MDKRKYMQELRDEIEGQENLESMAANDFIRADTFESMVEALSNTPMIMDEASIGKATEILRDRNAGSGPRMLALSRLQYAIAQNEELARYVLQLLADTENDPELRKSAHRAIQALTFSPEMFNLLRPQIMDVYRGLVTEKNQEIRESAITFLAQEKDEFVQRVLLDGLNNPASALIPEEFAVHLLGYDTHANVFPVLRRILSTSGNNKSRAEAAYLLGDDPESKELLLTVFNNKRERFDVRKSSLLSLKNLSTDDFFSMARQTALNNNENESLRAISFNALMDAPVTSKKSETEFRKVVKEMTKTLSSKELNEAARAYLKTKPKAKGNDTGE